MKVGWIYSALVALLVASNAVAQVELDIKNGDRLVSALTMGEGDHVVIAVHGDERDRQYFFSNNYSSKLGQSLVIAGFRVVAISWGGRSANGFPEMDAAAKYAKETGAKAISLMGHSRGGGLVAAYAKQQGDGVFNTVIQLGSVDDQGLSLPTTKKLFVFSKNDRVALWQPAAYEKSLEPKEMISLEGSAHGVKYMIDANPDLVAKMVALLKK